VPAKQAPVSRLDKAQAAKLAAPAEPQVKVGALSDQKKDGSAAAFAVQADALKAKEEQAREEETKVATAGTRAQSRTAPLTTAQPVAQAPQAPQRANEKDSQAARDELKKTQAEPLGQVAETVVVESGADARFRQKNEVAGRFAAAHVTGAKVVWRFGPAGSIERSADSGATWERQVSGATADLLAGSAPSAAVCWAVGRGGVVLRTTDGSTWVQLGSPTADDLFAIVAVDANRATVTTANGKRYATTDAGRTWRSL
jgi:photosystem II stability/assembly factor-like uncharacterized protein